MLPGRLLFERLLFRPLLRFRLAWFVAGALGCYLTLLIVLFTLAQREVALNGPFAACRAQRDAETGAITYLLTYRPADLSLGMGQLTLDPLGYAPPLPADLCHQHIVSVVYAQNTLGGPYPVNRVTLVALMKPIVVYVQHSNSAGRNFAAARANTLWLRGGGMALLSGALLGVGMWWERIRRALRLDPREGYADELPTSVPDLIHTQVEEALHWLTALPWGDGGAAPATSAVSAPGTAAPERRLAQGLALIRGWGGDDTRLVAGVTRLVGLPPAMAFTGGSVAALQLAAYAPLRWAPAGARLALAYAARALSEDPAFADAHVAYTQALAALGVNGDADRRAQAEAAFQTLRQRAPNHPQLPYTLAMLHLAHGRYAEASEALQNALTHANSDHEAQRILTQLAATLRRQGDLRQILGVFAWLARGARRRSLRYAPSGAAKARASVQPNLRPGARSRPSHR